MFEQRGVPISTPLLTVWFSGLHRCDRRLPSEGGPVDRHRGVVEQLEHDQQSLTVLRSGRLAVCVRLAEADSVDEPVIGGERRELDKIIDELNATVACLGEAARRTAAEVADALHWPAAEGCDGRNHWTSWRGGLKS
jgi:hypothetical protein